MGLDGEQCYIPEFVSKAVGEPLDIGLDKFDVVVISGVARGVCHCPCQGTRAVPVYAVLREIRPSARHPDVECFGPCLNLTKA